MAGRERKKGEVRPDHAMWVFICYFAVFILLYRLSPTILGALTFGWYLSMVIDVPARFLNRIRWLPYKAAVVISTLVLLALLTFGVSQLVPLLGSEGAKVFSYIKKAAESIDLNELLGIGAAGEAGGAAGAPDGAAGAGLMDTGAGWLDSLVENLTSRFSQIGISAVNYLMHGIPNAATAVVIFFITAGYFSALSPVLKKNLHRFFPATTSERSVRFVSDFYHDLRHFFGGQVLIALIVGILVGLGMFIVGMPYALFLGFLSFITNFIPFLGVFVTAVPALIIGLTNGGLFGVLKVAVVLVAANQIESWVLSPKIQGERMKLNWFAIILSVFLCGSLLGLLCVLLAIPILVFFKRFWVSYGEEFMRAL